MENSLQNEAGETFPSWFQTKNNFVFTETWWAKEYKCRSLNIFKFAWWRKIDDINHFVTSTTQGRCKLFKKNTKTMCKKCNVYLHFTQRGESNASKTTTANIHILICWSCSAYSSYKIFFCYKSIFFLVFNMFFHVFMFYLYLMCSWINWNYIVEDFLIFTHHCSTNGTSNIMLTLHCSVNRKCHIYHTKHDRALIFWI